MAGRHAEAVVSLRQAISHAPDLKEAHYSLAMALSRAGDLPLAIRLLDDIVRRWPNFFQAWCNLVAFIISARKLDRADELIERLLLQWPQAAEAHYYAGSLRTMLGQPNRAIVHYNRSLTLPLAFGDSLPNVRTQTLMHQAITYLTLGDYERGFSGKRHLWYVQNREYAGQIWDGEDLAGKSILLTNDGCGSGDVIQFFRFVPELLDCGALVSIFCHPSLHRLLARDGVQLVSEFDPPPECDFHCNLYVLPQLLKVRLDESLRPQPYLTGGGETWKWRLAPDEDLHVGIVWAGNPNHLADAARSMRLDDFAPLGGIKNVSFYSLQKGPPAKQALFAPPGLRLCDSAAEFNDFADTAAFIANLDLVIAVDTSVAHLAGAMGKPVWVLLPFVSDWRWLRDRSDSPWYPSARLFRQPRHDDWASVMLNVRVALCDLAQSRPE